MPKPQQPEIRRSGHTLVDQEYAEEIPRGTPASRGWNAPVPEDNRPGHHPPKEQDKPDLGGGRDRGAEEGDGGTRGGAP